MRRGSIMVAVPHFCPDVPPLKKNPVFLFYPDGFQKPNPFQPDIAVAIDSVVERKLDALVAIESQFVEGGALGVPSNHGQHLGSVRGCERAVDQLQEQGAP